MTIIRTAEEHLAALEELGSQVISNNQHLERAVMDGFNYDNAPPPTVLERAYMAPSGIREREANTREELSHVEKQDSAKFDFLVSANPEDIAKRLAELREALLTNTERLGMALSEKHPDYKPNGPDSKVAFSTASKGPETEFLSGNNKGPDIT